MSEDDDKCSCSPDYPLGFEFRSCCAVHDEDYALAVLPRREADAKFRKCLSREATVLPWIYWCGVRLFGGSHYGKKQAAVTPPAKKA